MYTKLENKYKKYFHLKEEDWHKKVIGEYHVSGVGCDTSHLEQHEHSGPCLRQTFYDYTDEIENSVGTEGNFAVGTNAHEVIQGIRKKNKPMIISEFPLGMLHGDKKLLGSIDLVEFQDLTHYPIEIMIVDIKTANDGTFPKDDENLKITHENQVLIYSYWLQNFVLNEAFMVIKSYRIIYVNKNNWFVGEITRPYNNKIGANKFMEFLTRCNKLHRYLKEETLPPAEPMRWCKYCKYGQRCYSNALHDDTIRSFTQEEVEEIYKIETGKSAIWQGKYTKAFESFKMRFKIEDV